MQMDQNRIRMVIRNILLLTVTALAMPLWVQGQDNVIALPLRELSASELFEEIENQTDFVFMVNRSKFDGNLKISITQSKMPVTEVLDKLFANSGITYAVNGKIIVVPMAPDGEEEELVPLPKLGDLSGRIINSADNTAVDYAEVSIIGVGQKTKTDTLGNFHISNVPSGGQALRIAMPKQDTVIYVDVLVLPNTENWQEINVAPRRMPLRNAGVKQVPDITPSEEIVSYTERNVLIPTRRNGNGDKHTYMLVDPTTGARHYRPKVALKTNVLYLATTTPNIAAEFYLAPQWTFNIAVGVNPWDLNDRKGGIRHALVQPEARYWFCNAFERHFVGLHGLYGSYQLSDINLPVKDLTNKRYDGSGAGIGASYGYHMPLSPNWAMEFSAGLGYVRFNYKEYRCGECDNLKGKFKKNYFGPTKLAVSLVWMIK